MEILKQLEVQDKEKAEWQEEQDAIKDEKAKAGEKYKPEPREWPLIEPAPFITADQKFVVCVDTLGQDRALSDEQKRFALETAQKFKAAWEKFESKKLTLDRNQRVELAALDGEYFKEHGDKLKEEEEQFIEDQIKGMEEEPEDDDARNLVAVKLRLQHLASLFKENETMKARCELVKKYKVIKYGRMVQALFYFLGFQKELVTEEGTQKFFWKSAVTHMNEDFISKMMEYTPTGAKAQDFKKYQTINYIEKCLEGITAVQVDEFNTTVFGRLFTWLRFAIDSRKADIIRRKALIHKEREERDFKLKAAEDRAAKRTKELEDAQDKFLEDHKEDIEIFEAYQRAQTGGEEAYGEEEEDEEASQAKPKEPPVLPVFNEEEFLTRWDEEIPEITVSGSAEDDIDNDWILTEEEIE